MAVFTFLDSLKLISRKIRETWKSWNFHTLWFFEIKLFENMQSKIIRSGPPVIHNVAVYYVPSKNKVSPKSNCVSWRSPWCSWCSPWCPWCPWCCWAPNGNEPVKVLALLPPLDGDTISTDKNIWKINEFSWISREMFSFSMFCLQIAKKARSKATKRSRALENHNKTN